MRRNAGLVRVNGGAIDVVEPRSAGPPCPDPQPHRPWSARSTLVRCVCWMCVCVCVCVIFRKGFSQRLATRVCACAYMYAFLMRTHFHTVRSASDDRALHCADDAEGEPWITRGVSFIRRSLVPAVCTLIFSRVIIRPPPRPSPPLARAHVQHVSIRRYPILTFILYRDLTSDPDS